MRCEVFQIVVYAMDVFNILGHELLEKAHEHEPAIEFSLRGFPYKHQPRFAVIYKGVNVGDYIPDPVVMDKFVADARTIERITTVESGQILNYLRITQLKVGLILNFKNPRLEWERFVL